MSPKAQASLEIVSGRQPGKRLDLGTTALEIGREAGPDGRLGDDPQLSRRHARISVRDDGRLTVEDLGSTNGTFVNGDRISAATALGPGDIISVGDTTLRVVSPSEGEQGGPRPPRRPAQGGVHTVPTELLKLLVARAPVKREWIVKACLSAIPVVVAVNFVVRTIAVQYLDVRGDLPTMRPYVLFVISVAPVVADSYAFWKSFGRPTGHSTIQYLAPALAATLIFATIELILLPSNASALEYAATAAVPVVPPTVILPAMLGLRVRTALAAEGELGAAQTPEKT